MKFKKYLAATLLCCAIPMTALAQTYSEGWYQIKRTIGVGEVADLDFTKLSTSSVSSLLSDVSYLNTAEEISSKITIPILNISAGTAVYGARMLSVSGATDFASDLLVASGRNANEKLLSTYYYITPIAADDDGDWRYTIRSVNGHYMGTNGRYYAEPKEVYINTSLGISLDSSTDAIMSSLTSLFGTSIGSKQTTLSMSYIDSIPYIDQLNIYSRLKPIIDVLGNTNVKIAEYTWTKKSIVDAESGDSTLCVGSTSMLETLSSMAQNSEQILSYYNDSDYESIFRLLLKYTGLDLFKLKKINLSNVATTSGIFAKHIKVTPYKLSIIGFGDNFSLSDVDYNTIDALTKLSQKTNRNARMEYSGAVANENALTQVYNGGSFFLTSGTSVDDAALTLLSDSSTDLVDLSHAQSLILTDDDAYTADVIISSPKKSSILSQWSDNYKTVKINSAGYATLYTPFELTIPEAEKSIFGTVTKSAPKVYVATKRDNSDIYFSEVEERIPANTAVLIKGDANRSYNFTVVEADDASAEPISDNLLSGTYVAYNLQEGVNAYTLATDADSKQPILSLLNGENSSIDAWQAYFIDDSADILQSFNILFDDSSTTGITLTTDATDAETIIYDVAGRIVRTQSPAPGLYIINGVKTLIAY
jgi:hypothetical protein